MIRSPHLSTDYENPSAYIPGDACYPFNLSKATPRLITGSII